MGDTIVYHRLTVNTLRLFHLVSPEELFRQLRAFLCQLQVNSCSWRVPITTCYWSIPACHFDWHLGIRLTAEIGNFISKSNLAMSVCVFGGCWWKYRFVNVQADWPACVVGGAFKFLFLLTNHTQNGVTTDHARFSSGSISGSLSGCFTATLKLLPDNNRASCLTAWNGCASPNLPFWLPVLPWKPWIKKKKPYWGKQCCNLFFV